MGHLLGYARLFGEYTVAAIATTLGVSQACLYRHLETTRQPRGTCVREVVQAARGYGSGPIR